MRTLQAIVANRLWPANEPSQPLIKLLFSVGRFVYGLARDLGSGELSLRAMGLVYTTMLSTVPMLGLAFALAKTLGLHRGLEPALNRALEPIGERAEEITSNIIGFADNVNSGVLSILSLSLLLVTVISMAQKVRSSFNFVWRVNRSRSILHRLGEFISVALIGPLVIIVALTLIASLSSAALVEQLRSVEPLGSWIARIGDLLPILLTVLAFFFLYIFVPNTKVKFLPAMIGGVIGGLTWVASGYLFTSLVASSARMLSIYSGFAIVLILMFWLYLSWMILLLGAQLAFYLQNPFHLRFGLRMDPIDNDARERLSLSLMYLIACDTGLPVREWTQESLALALRVPRATLDPILAALLDSGLLVSSAGEILVPGRDPHHIRLAEILTSVRRSGRNWYARHASWNESADEIADRIDQAIDSELGDTTLGQLVDNSLFAKTG